MINLKAAKASLNHSVALAPGIYDETSDEALMAHRVRRLYFSCSFTRLILKYARTFGHFLTTS
jgi:hypothetical protein